MQKTANLRRQHDDILQIATEISNNLNLQNLSQNSSHIPVLLSKLAGKVKLHLAMEDKSLYPNLLKDSDEKIKSLAKQYMNEMGGISDAFMQYLGKWKTPQAIQENASAFINETKGLFNVLGKRIERENNELYPIVDNA